MSEGRRGKRSLHARAAAFPRFLSGHGHRCVTLTDPLVQLADTFAATVITALAFQRDTDRTAIRSPHI